MADVQTVMTHAEDVTMEEAAEVVEEVIKTDSIEFQEQIDALSQEKLREYYERRAELERKIKELSSLDDEGSLALAKADLETVEVEIAKRAENMGMLLTAIANKMTFFSQLGDKVYQDTEEDIAKRQDALDALEKIQAAIIEAKATVSAAETAKATADTEKAEVETELAVVRKSWNFFTKGGKIERALGDVSKAQRRINSARSIITAGPETIAELEESLESAQEEIVSVEEQIKIDKEYRLNQLSLDELYATLTQWEAEVFKILEEDVKDITERIGDTETALVNSRDLGVSEARRLQKINEDMAELKGNLSEKERALRDIRDQTDPEYLELRNVVADISMELDKLNSERMIVEGNISTAEVNVRELEASLSALNSDLLLARRNHNDFALNAEAARDVGKNIAQLAKNQTAKSISASLSRSRDAMTLTIVDASIKIDVSTRRHLADRAESRVDLLRALDTKVQAGDEALAEQAVRHDKASEEYKKSYGKKPPVEVKTTETVAPDVQEEEADTAENAGPRLI